MVLTQTLLLPTVKPPLWVETSSGGVGPTRGIAAVSRTSGSLHTYNMHMYIQPFPEVKGESLHIRSTYRRVEPRLVAPRRCTRACCTAWNPLRLFRRAHRLRWGSRRRANLLTLERLWLVIGADWYLLLRTSTIRQPWQVTPPRCGTLTGKYFVDYPAWRVLWHQKGRHRYADR